MTYRHLFFDLDRTIWDFETNSYETLTELAHSHGLPERGIESIDRFIHEYIRINDQLWEHYGKGLISKETLRFERFHQALSKFNVVDRELAIRIGNEYVKLSPVKTNLFPDAIEVLNYLKSKYTLHIITNGFEEVQHIKIKNCGLSDYFKEVVTSERAGFKKPDVRIFQYSMDVANAVCENSLMIGDNLDADIAGARNAGIHQVYFNPQKREHQEQTTYEINHLTELMNFL